MTSYCVAAGSTNYVNAATVPRKSFAIQITPERLALSCRMKKTSAPLATACAFPPLVNSISACLVKAALTCAIAGRRYPATGAGSAYFSGAAGEETDPFPASKQHRYYAKLIVHWRLKRQKERSDESVSTEFIPTVLLFLRFLIVAVKKTIPPVTICAIRRKKRAITLSIKPL